MTPRAIQERKQRLNEQAERERATALRNVNSAGSLDAVGAAVNQPQLTATISGPNLLDGHVRQPTSPLPANDNR